MNTIVTSHRPYDDDVTSLEGAANNANWVEDCVLTKSLQGLTVKFISCTAHPETSSRGGSTSRNDPGV